MIRLKLNIENNGVYITGSGDIYPVFICGFIYDFILNKIN